MRSPSGKKAQNPKEKPPRANKPLAATEEFDKNQLRA
jgi:hypothetical protein